MTAFRTRFGIITLAFLVVLVFASVHALTTGDGVRAAAVACVSGHNIVWTGCAGVTP